MKTLTAFAAAAAIALTLGGCAPAADTSTDSGTSTDTTEDSTDGGFAGVTLPGTGTYAVPAGAPIGSYELPDNQDAQPDGCTWSLTDSNGSVLAENTGPFLFLTEEVATFTTNGCPDWVQYE